MTRTFCDKCNQTPVIPHVLKLPIDLRYFGDDAEGVTYPVVTVEIVIRNPARDHESPDLCGDCTLDLVEEAVARSELAAARHLRARVQGSKP